MIDNTHPVSPTHVTPSSSPSGKSPQVTLRPEYDSVVGLDHPATLGKSPVSASLPGTAAAQALSAASRQCLSIVTALEAPDIEALADTNLVSTLRWYAKRLDKAQQEAPEGELRDAIAAAHQDIDGLVALLERHMPVVPVTMAARPSGPAGQALEQLHRRFEEYCFQPLQPIVLSVTGPQPVKDGASREAVPWYDAARAAGFLRAGEQRYWHMRSRQDNGAPPWMAHLQALRGPHAAAMRFALHLHLQTGIAPGELLQLRWRDLVPRPEQWHIHDGQGDDAVECRLWSLRIERDGQPAIEVELDAHAMALAWPLLTGYGDRPDALLLADADGMQPGVAELALHGDVIRHWIGPDTALSLAIETTVDERTAEAIRHYEPPSGTGHKLRALRKRATANPTDSESRKGRTLLRQAKWDPSLVLYKGADNQVEGRALINGVRFGFRMTAEHVMDESTGAVAVRVGGFALSRLHFYALPAQVLARIEQEHGPALAQAKAVLAWRHSTEELLTQAINPGQGRALAGRPGWYRYRSTMHSTKCGHVLEIDARVQDGQIRQLDGVRIDPEPPVAVEVLAQSDAAFGAFHAPVDEAGEAEEAQAAEGAAQAGETPGTSAPTGVSFQYKPAWRRPEVFTIDAGALAVQEEDSDTEVEAEAGTPAGEDVAVRKYVIAAQNSISHKIGCLPVGAAGDDGQPPSALIPDCGFNALIMNIPRLQDICRHDRDGAHSATVLDELKRRVCDYKPENRSLRPITRGGLTNFLVVDLLAEEGISATKVNGGRREEYGALLDASHAAREHLLLHTPEGSVLHLRGDLPISPSHFVTLVPVAGGWKLYDPMRMSQKPRITRAQLLALMDQVPFNLYSLSAPNRPGAVPQCLQARREARQAEDAAAASRLATARANPGAGIDSPVLSYYLFPSAVPAGSGAMAVSLDTHRAQTRQELEDNHRYIQRMFPTDEKSKSWPDAPTLSAEDIIAFRADAGLRDELAKSFKTMLAFYHLEYDDGEPVTIRMKDGFDPDRAGWFGTQESKFNHNYQRITRILRSLRLLGCGGDADAFMQCLHKIYSKYGDRIAPGSYQLWQDANSGSGPSAARRAVPHVANANPATAAAPRWRVASNVSYAADADRVTKQKVRPQLLLQELAAYLSGGKRRDPAPFLKALLAQHPQQGKRPKGAYRALVKVPRQWQGQAIPLILDNGLERRQGSLCLPLEISVHKRHIVEVRIVGMNELDPQAQGGAWKLGSAIRYLSAVDDGSASGRQVESRLRELSARLHEDVDWLRLLEPFLKKHPAQSGWYAVSVPHALPQGALSAYLGHTVRTRGDELALDLVVQLDAQDRTVRQVCLCTSAAQAQALRERFEREAQADGDMGLDDQVTQPEDAMDIDTDDDSEDDTSWLSPEQRKEMQAYVMAQVDAYEQEEEAAGYKTFWEDKQAVMRRAQRAFMEDIEQNALEQALLEQFEKEAEDELARVSEQGLLAAEALLGAYRKANLAGMGMSEGEAILERIIKLEEELQYELLMQQVMVYVQGRDLTQEEESEMLASLLAASARIAEELNVLEQTGEPVPSIEWFDETAGLAQLQNYLATHPQATSDEVLEYAATLATVLAQQHGRMRRMERRYLLEERWRLAKASNALTHQKVTGAFAGPYFRLLARRAAVLRYCEELARMHLRLQGEDLPDWDEEGFADALDARWTEVDPALELKTRIALEAAHELLRQIDARLPAARLQWQIAHADKLPPKERQARLARLAERALTKLGGMRYANLRDLALDYFEGLRKRHVRSTGEPAGAQPAVVPAPAVPRAAPQGLLLDLYLPAIRAWDQESKGGNGVLTALAQARPQPQPLESYLADRLRPCHENPDPDLPPWLRRFNSGGQPPWLLARVLRNQVTDVRIDTPDNRAALGGYRLRQARLQAIAYQDRRRDHGRLSRLAGGWWKAEQWLLQRIQPEGGRVIDPTQPQMQSFAINVQDAKDRQVYLLAWIEDGEIADVRVASLEAYLSMAFGRATAGRGVNEVRDALRQAGCTTPLDAFLSALVQGGDGEAVHPAYPSCRRYRSGVFDGIGEEIVLLVRLRRGYPCEVCLDTDDQWQAMARYALGAQTRNIIQHQDGTRGHPLRGLAGGNLAAFWDLLSEQLALDRGRAVQDPDGGEVPATLQRYTLTGSDGATADVLAEVVDGEIVDVRIDSDDNRRQMIGNARIDVRERRKKVLRGEIDTRSLQVGRPLHTRESRYHNIYIRDRRVGGALARLAHKAGHNFGDYLDAIAADHTNALMVDAGLNIHSHASGQGQAWQAEAPRILVRRDDEGNVVDARVHTAHNLVRMRARALRQRQTERAAMYKRIMVNDFRRGNPLALLARREKRPLGDFVDRYILQAEGTPEKDLPDGSAVRRYRTPLWVQGRPAELLARFDARGELVDAWPDLSPDETVPPGRLDDELQAACLYLEMLPAQPAWDDAVDDDAADACTVSDADLQLMTAALLDDLSNAPLLKHFGGYLEYLRGELALKDFTEALRVLLETVVHPDTAVRLPDGRMGYALSLTDSGGHPLYLVPQLEGRAIKGASVVSGPKPPDARAPDDATPYTPDPATWPLIAEVFCSTNPAFLLEAMPQAFNDTAYDVAAALKGWVVLKVQPHLALPALVGDAPGHRRFRTGLKHPVSGKEFFLLAHSEGGKLATLDATTGSGALLLPETERDRLAQQIYTEGNLRALKRALQAMGGDTLFDLQNNLAQLLHDCIRPEAAFHLKEDPVGFACYASGHADPDDGRPFLFQARTEQGLIVEIRVFKGHAPGDTVPDAEALSDDDIVMEDAMEEAQDEDGLQAQEADDTAAPWMAAAAALTDEQRETMDYYADGIVHDSRPGVRLDRSAVLAQLIEECGVQITPETILEALAPDHALRDEAMAVVGSRRRTTGRQADDKINKPKDKPSAAAIVTATGAAGGRAPFFHRHWNGGAAAPWELVNHYLMEAYDAASGEDGHGFRPIDEAGFRYIAVLLSHDIDPETRQALRADANGARRQYTEEEIEALIAQAGAVPDAQQVAAVLNWLGARCQGDAFVPVQAFALDEVMAAAKELGLTSQQLARLLDDGSGDRQAMAWLDGQACVVWRRCRESGQWTRLDSRQAQQQAGNPAPWLQKHRHAATLLMAPQAADPLVQLLMARGKGIAQARTALMTLLDTPLHPLGLVQDMMRQLDGDGTSGFDRLPLPVRQDLYAHYESALLQGYLQAALGRDAVERIEFDARGPVGERGEQGAAEVETDETKYAALAPSAALAVLALPPGAARRYLPLRRIGGQWQVREGKDSMPLGAWLAARCRDGQLQPEALATLQLIALPVRDAGEAAKLLRAYENRQLGALVVEPETPEDLPATVHEGDAAEAATEIAMTQAISEPAANAEPTYLVIASAVQSRIWTRFQQKDALGPLQQKEALVPLQQRWETSTRYAALWAGSQVPASVLSGIAQLCDMRRKQAVFDEVTNRHFPDIHRFALNTGDWAGSTHDAIPFEVLVWHGPNDRGEEAVLGLRLLSVNGRPCPVPPKLPGGSWAQHLRIKGPQHKWSRHNSPSPSPAPAGGVALSEERAAKLANSRALEYGAVFVLYRSSGARDDLAHHYASPRSILTDLVHTLLPQARRESVLPLQNDDGGMEDFPGIFEYAIDNAWGTGKSLRVYVREEDGHLQDMRVAEKIRKDDDEIGQENEKAVTILLSMRAGNAILEGRQKSAASRGSIQGGGGAAGGLIIGAKAQINIGKTFVQQAELAPILKHWEASTWYGDLNVKSKLPTSVVSGIVRLCVLPGRTVHDPETEVDFPDIHRFSLNTQDWPGHNQGGIAFDVLVWHRTNAGGKDEVLGMRLVTVGDTPCSLPKKSQGGSWEQNLRLRGPQISWSNAHSPPAQDGGLRVDANRVKDLAKLRGNQFADVVKAYRLSGGDNDLERYYATVQHVLTDIVHTVCREECRETIGEVRDAKNKPLDLAGVATYRIDQPWGTEYSFRIYVREEDGRVVDLHLAEQRGDTTIGQPGQTQRQILQSMCDGKARSSGKKQSRNKAASRSTASAAPASQAVSISPAASSSHTGTLPPSATTAPTTSGTAPLRTRARSYRLQDIDAWRQAQTALGKQNTATAGSNTPGNSQSLQNLLTRASTLRNIPPLTPQAGTGTWSMASTSKLSMHKVATPTTTVPFGFPKRLLGVALTAESWQSLAPGKMVTDEVICYAYKHLGAQWPQVAFIDPGLVLQLGHPEVHGSQPEADDPMDVDGAEDNDDEQAARRAKQAREAVNIANLELKDAAVVLFPINDQRIANTGGTGDLVSQMSGGSHWVLLAWDRRVQHENAFHYYDSANRNKADLAERKTAEAIVAAVNAANQRPSTFKVHAAPQQGPSDCGVYVIEMSRALAHRHGSGNAPFGALGAGSGEDKVRPGNPVRQEWRSRIEQASGEIDYQPWLKYEPVQRDALRMELADALDMGVLDPNGSGEAPAGVQINLTGVAWPTPAKLLQIHNGVAYFQPLDITRNDRGRFVRKLDDQEMIDRTAADPEYEGNLKHLPIHGVPLAECPDLKDARAGQSWRLAPKDGRKQQAVAAVLLTDKGKEADDAMALDDADSEDEEDSRTPAQIQVGKLMEVLYAMQPAPEDDGAPPPDNAISSQAQLIRALGASADADLFESVDQLWNHEADEVPEVLQDEAIARLQQRLSLPQQEWRDVRAAVGVMGSTSQYSLGKKYDELSEATREPKPLHDTHYWHSPGTHALPQGLHLVAQQGLECGLHALAHCVGEALEEAFTMQQARRLMLREYIRCKSNKRMEVSLGKEGFLKAIADDWKTVGKQLARTAQQDRKAAIDALVEQYEATGLKQAKEDDTEMTVIDPEGGNLAYMMNRFAYLSVDLLLAMLKDVFPDRQHEVLNIGAREGTVKELQACWQAFLEGREGGRVPHFAVIRDNAAGHYFALRVMKDGRVYCIDSQGGDNDGPCWSEVPGKTVEERLGNVVTHLVSALRIADVDKQRMSMVVSWSDKPGKRKDAPQAEDGASPGKRVRHEHLASDGRYVNRPVTHWKKPTRAELQALQARDDATGPRHFSGQIVVQMEPDGKARRGALHLYGKHPRHTVLMQWNPQRGEIRALAEPQQALNPQGLRIVLVAISRETGGVQTVGGQQAHELARQFMRLLTRQLKYTRTSSKPLPAVNVVACGSGPGESSATARSYTENFTRALTPHLVRWVSGYGDPVRITPTGRKRKMDTEGTPVKTRFTPVDKHGSTGLEHANASYIRAGGREFMYDQYMAFDPQQADGRWVQAGQKRDSGERLFVVVEEGEQAGRTRKVRVTLEEGQRYGLSAVPSVRGNVFRFEQGRFRMEVEGKA